MPDFSKLREDYKQASLDETDVHPDLYIQFGVWFDQAITSGLREPNAMTLATATRDGIPAARIVLLKDVDPATGFTFFTNYGSAKASELEDNPRAALVFYWNELERQVRIQGLVAKVPAEESAAYFATRPLLSQFGAVASPQSQVIPDRAWLEARMENVREEYGGHPPPRPAHWGGYRIAPQTVEFWQGRRSRLHDRIRYRLLDSGEWKIERLAP
jgi:pyridoxamine 5'-phosphate oxidase